MVFLDYPLEITFGDSNLHHLMSSLSSKLKKKNIRICISDSPKDCAATAQDWDPRLCPRLLPEQPAHKETEADLRAQRGWRTSQLSLSQLPKAAAATMLCPSPQTPTLPAPWGPMLTNKCKYGPKCSTFDCTEMKEKLTGYGKTARNCSLS